MDFPMARLREREHAFTDGLDEITIGCQVNVGKPTESKMLRCTMLGDRPDHIRFVNEVHRCLELNYSAHQELTSHDFVDVARCPIRRTSPNP